MRGTYFKIDDSLNSTELEDAFIVYNGTGQSYSEVTLSQLIKDHQNDRVGRLRGIEWVFVAFKSGELNENVITFRQEPWQFSFAYALYICVMALTMVFGFCYGRKK